MKVVLRKETSNLGEEDSLIEVSNGYARNYLFPRKLAVPATPSEIAALEKRKTEKEKKLAEKRAEHEELAKKLSSLEVSIPVDAGEGGKLFGSVTSQDIAEAVQKISQIDIDKKKIELAEPIKVVGQYSIPIKLFQDVSATLKVKIEARKSG
ncbi:MAG: 50S ribosomal protein L9 [Candidatus Margulisiibacteriota bacterium]